MTWSLGVEEQFYAVIPFLMVLLVGIRRRLLLPTIFAACVVSFLFASLGLSRHPDFVFYMLPSRAWELGVGVALAVAESSGTRFQLSGLPAQVSSLAGFALMIAPVFLLSKASPFPGAAALPSVLGTALVLSARASFINKRLLSTPPLVFMGKVSYSWYLWHWPLIAFAHILYDDTLQPTTAFLAVATAFTAAVLSYYLIEQPMRRSSRAPVALLLRYGVASLVILAASAVIWKSHGFPQRFPALTRVEMQLELDKHGIDLGNRTLKDKPTERKLKPAYYGPKAEGPIVAVWGDSHAGAMAPGLRLASIAEGYGFVLFGRGACPPLTGASVYTPRLPLDEPGCSLFNRKTLEMLKDNQNIRIVVLVAYWELPFRMSNPGQGNDRYWLTTDQTKSHEIPTLVASRDILIHSLTATIQNLEAAGKEVVVFEDVPNFAFNPLMRIRTSGIPARRAVATWLGTQDVNDLGFAAPFIDPGTAMATSAVKQTVSQFSGVELVDPKPKLCRDPSQCFYRDGDWLLYEDSQHVSPDGARYALRDFLLPVPSELNKSSASVAP